jgi:hypothetical protein
MRSWSELFQSRPSVGPSSFPGSFGAGVVPYCAGLGAGSGAGVVPDLVPTSVPDSGIGTKVPTLFVKYKRARNVEMRTRNPEPER